MKYESVVSTIEAVCITGMGVAAWFGKTDFLIYFSAVLIWIAMPSPPK